MEGEKKGGKGKGRRAERMEQDSENAEGGGRKEGKRSKDAAEWEEDRKGRMNKSLRRKGEGKSQCTCVNVKCQTDFGLMTHCKIKPLFSCPSLE